MKLTISVLDSQGNVKAYCEGEKYAKMVYTEGYENGDIIKMTTDTINQFYEIKIDETIKTANVLMTENEWCYKIDFDKRKRSLNQNAFNEEFHYLYIKESKPKEKLSENPLDQKEFYGMYPHASANAETTSTSSFACNNVIDGLDANWHHGKWPYTSWGIAGRKDACLKLEFGRKVIIEKVVIYLRAQWPHDSWWTQGTISFDGQNQTVLHFEKTADPQEYAFDNIEAEYLEFYDLIKADDESQFPSLSLIEVYGKEA